MNPGKVFERDFRSSIPPGVWNYRLKDCGGWSKSEDLRFTPRNSFDLIIFDSKSGILYPLELKTTKSNLWPYKNLSKTEEAGLLNAAKYKNVISGVILNFRKSFSTFFIPILPLIALRDFGTRKSITPEMAKVGIKIEQNKKRIHYSYDVEKFLVDGQNYYKHASNAIGV